MFYTCVLKLKHKNKCLTNIFFLFYFTLHFCNCMLYQCVPRAYLNNLDNYNDRVCLYANVYQSVISYNNKLYIFKP